MATAGSTVGSERSPIVLIGSFTPDAEQSWLQALRVAMPREQVLAVADVADRRSVDVAIVANPDPAVVASFESLKWVQSLWAGVEKLVAEPAFAKVPLVRMIDPELTRTMAEAVLAWTLYLHREMPTYLAQQRARQWRQLPYVAPSARRIGLLGLGVLGQAAARVLHTAGFAVQGWSRSAKRIDALPGVAAFSGSDGLHAMVRDTDILVCLLPLTTQTRNLVDSELLRRLPPGARLINFGRGAVVDTSALLSALDDGTLAHAVLDVFEREPLPAQSALWAHPRVTVLPHIAAETDMRTASQVVAGNVERWRETGRIPQAVDNQRGY